MIINLRAAFVLEHWRERLLEQSTGWKTLLMLCRRIHSSEEDYSESP
jgi:hypothetical protein